MILEDSKHRTQHQLSVSQWEAYYKKQSSSSFSRVCFSSLQAEPVVEWPVTHFLQPVLNDSRHKPFLLLRAALKHKIILNKTVVSNFMKNILGLCLLMKTAVETFVRFQN